MGNQVFIVADASYCQYDKVGAIAWAIGHDKGVEYGGRPIFEDSLNIGDVELKAISEGVIESTRFRRKHYNVRTIAVTDNVHAYIELKIRKVAEGREYVEKHLLKALPRRLRFLRKYHKECDRLCKEILSIARKEII